jgi:hypothetical protein
MGRLPPPALLVLSCVCDQLACALTHCPWALCPALLTGWRTQPPATCCKQCQCSPWICCVVVGVQRLPQAVSMPGLRALILWFGAHWLSAWGGSVVWWLVCSGSCKQCQCRAPSVVWLAPTGADASSVDAAPARRCATTEKQGVTDSLFLLWWRAGSRKQFCSGELSLIVFAYVVSFVWVRTVDGAERLCAGVGPSLLPTWGLLTCVCVSSAGCSSFAHVLARQADSRTLCAAA